MAMPRSSRTSCLAALVLARVLSAQNGPNPQPPVQSDLLDQLLGSWDITGMIRGAPVHEKADAEWVLAHQFLRIHRQQIEGPAESVVHVGFDTVLQRFVAFRLDNLGARGGETLGYGRQTADKLQFNFEYPTSQIRETWSWDAKEKTWQFLVEIRKKDSKSANFDTFSTLTLRSVRGGRGRPRGFGPQAPLPQPPPSPQPPPPQP
jgi:hypothetical protein